MKSFQVGDKPKTPRGKNKLAVIPASPAGSWAATTGAEVLSRFVALLHCLYRPTVAKRLHFQRH